MPETARRNSPVHPIPKTPRPTLIVVGADEGPECHRQSDDLVTAWRKHGVPCEMMDLASHNHFSIMGELERPESTLSRTILAQMASAAALRP